VPVDRNSLPKDPEILQQMLVDLTTQLDKTQRLLSQLLSAKSGTHSEQLSVDQLRLFVQELNAAESEAAEKRTRTTMFRQTRLPTAVRTKTKAAGEDAALCRHT
jgi:hypothetical protein